MIKAKTTLKKRFNFLAEKRKILLFQKFLETPKLRISH